MSEALIELAQVFKTFKGMKTPVLQDLTASIGAGQIVGLVGPDGAGKTTLMRLLAGLLLPTAGTITVAGFDTVSQAAAIHRLIGYMPQKFGLYEDLTVQQNLRLYADLRGLPKVDRGRVYEKLLAFTGLSSFVSRLARHLSGGMKQKLGLACALIAQPTLVLLDEPSVGVDPISRRELWKMMKELLDDGISVIWSTSYLDEAQQCDSVILLNMGRILFHGAPYQMSQHLQGRIFEVSGIRGSRRALLESILDHDNVLDAVVQAKGLRVVVLDPNSSFLSPTVLGDERELVITPIAPRFEDAFIDALGGGPRGRSGLAARMAPIQGSRGEIVVEARGLTKQFGTFTAAHELSFDVYRGEILGLLGPNGAGKSTTFRMLCGLLKPTAGGASVEGVELRMAGSLARSHIGYMAQKFSLYGGLSVLQNLRFFAGAYNLRRSDRKEAIKQMIDSFDFTPYLNVSADALPLGYKQRLALACALMHKPKVLFLDEPTSGVDPITRREFWNHINGFVERGMTVIVTTHFMEEADYCDRIGLVYRGQLIVMDSPDALKDRATNPKHPHPTLEDAFIQLIEEYDAKHRPS